MQWSVLIFSTTSYTNADQVRGPHCIRIIRKIRAARIELFLQVAFLRNSKDSKDSC